MGIVTQKLKFSDIKANLEQDVRNKFDDDDVFIRKSFDSALAEDKGDHVIVSKITTLALDRDNEVVLPEGLVVDGYNRTVLWCHDYTPKDVPHARNRWIKPDNPKNPTALLAATEYTPADINPFGDKVYKYCAADWPMGKSIGFIPLASCRPGDSAWKDTLSNWKGRYSDYLAKEKGIEAKSQNITDPECIYKKWAILEYSDVPVPANPEAVQMMVQKGLLNADKAKEFGYEDGVERVDNTKPLPNEHSCRMQEPEKYDSFARDNCKAKVDDKCLDFLYGIKAGTSELQAYRYRLEEGWTAEAAGAHCSKHNGKFEAARGKAEDANSEILVRLAALEQLLETLTSKDKANIIEEDDISSDEIDIETAKALIRETLVVEKQGSEPLVEDVLKDIPTADELLAFARGKPV